MKAAHRHQDTQSIGTLKSEGQPSPKRRPVRTYLAWLVVACLLPCAIGATGLFYFEYQKGREQLAKDTTQTARALIQAIDNHLLLAKALAQTLSTDEALARGDLAGFHERARQVIALSGLGTNVVLRNLQGRQILNTAIDYGKPLPASHAPEQTQGVFATDKPTVSDVFTGPVLKRPIMSVDVPVRLGGNTVYALGIGILPEHFNTILNNQALPSDWIVGVFDKAGTIVGRSHLPDKFVGQKLTPELMEALGRKSEGVIDGRTKEGIPSIVVFSRSKATDWGVAIGISRTSVAGALARTLTMIALGAAILFCMSLLLAAYVGRKIAAPITALTGPAAALGTGSSVSVPDLPLKEAHEVSVALDQAQAALMQSKEEARAAAERVQLALAAGAIVGTWDWNLQTGRITVDERFAESFGIDPSLGRTGLSQEQVIATVHPEDLPDLRVAIAEAISRGGPYSREYRVRGTDGLYRWIEANGRVDHGVDGTPLRFPGVLIDLERRRAVEAERDRAAQLLRAFVDAVPGVVYAKDRDGRLLVANQGVTDLVGKPPEAYLGKTDIEFLDNKEQAAIVMATDRRIMESGRPETVDEEISFSDGRKAIWHSIKAPFRDAKGQVIGLIGSSVDITARKQAEAALHERTDEVAHAQLRLQMALTAGRMGVWEWSPATGEATWSSQMFEILGLPASDDGRTRGELFLAMVHPEDRGKVDAALARALNSGSDFEAETRIIDTDSRIRWLLIRGNVVSQIPGRPERVVGVTVDITERKEAEQALLDADRRRNEFLAMLGHELRNPLAPITTAVQLLELVGDQPERRHAALQIIRRQAEHMARLVDDLLEVSRVTQGRIELRKENILAASAVFSAAETVRPLVRQREQTLDLDVPTDVDLVADQARLIQVVANLLNNASKYTQQGGHISVRVRAAGDDEEWVEIVVADNGPGIDGELLPRVFDLFSQGTVTLDRSRGGLGLGLALVKRLVELHGGTVRAESAGPNMGAVFTLRLPRVDRRQVPRNLAVGLPARAIAPTSFLVVDDNPDALEMLVMLLEADGHRVGRARDGEEALTVARRFAPRVVLLDLGLPKLDGWEVARRLRADPATAGALVIALSGYGQASDRERSRDAGFDDHLLKPADIDAVYAAVAAHKERRNAS
ncbi:PAS domain S-box-containing protein [Noviherbaspirillum humi]|uniref:histidine kinase n=1 Tax=Noviherbaspirillum humi TaxID=1688639 RepID=A0A239KJP4_9BURK|nr:PAS domain-containing protein [Noviherbaspirillum humi]SNT18275.1 PAS domain S-box-containing protein [Noviherbaspirillum humi]